MAGILIANGQQSLYPGTLCILRYITMAVVNRSMGKVARENAGCLPSTLSVRRLATHSPGLVCPYRQAGLFLCTVPF